MGAMVGAAQNAALTRINREPLASQALLEQLAGSLLPEWATMRDSIRVIELEPRGTLFTQESEHPFIYVVRRGLLKNIYLREDGEEWVKSFIHEGMFFASFPALQPGGRTSFSAVAIESTTVERMPFAPLDALAHRHLAWGSLMQRALMIFAERKEKRERELLTLSPEERYRAFVSETPELAERIPQKDLARYLGLTPVGLNRIAKRVRVGG